MKTILIAGLGNPGKEYAKTRHNAGFVFADYFRKENRENFSDWAMNKKLKAEISLGKLAGKKIILLKPQTFMNLSGEAIAAALKYFKISIRSIRGETSNNLIVVHDEIDLPLGTFRISRDSSSAGHKGAQNVIDALGTKNFARLRIGVNSRTDKRISTEKYVLGKFTATELKIIMKTLEESAKELSKKIK